MQYTLTTLVLACATGLMASPLPGSPNGYVELSRHQASHGNGTVIYLGTPGGQKMRRSEDVDLEERASSSCQTTATPSCSGSHQARNDICDQLVTELAGDATTTVGQKPRQICYEGSAAESDDNAYCCVSWSQVVNNLNKGDLVNYANSVLRTCTSNGISGKVYNVKVEQTCTDVCLSNRGTGC